MEDLLVPRLLLEELKPRDGADRFEELAFRLPEKLLDEDPKLLDPEESER